MNKIQKFAIDYFVNKNQNAIHDIYDYFNKKIQWQKVNPVEFEEVQSNMNLAITQAINSYDITKGVQFHTYVWTCFRNIGGTDKIKRNAKKRGEGAIPKSIHEKLSYDSETEIAETIADKKDHITQSNRTIAFQQLIKSIEKHMTKKEQTILELYWEHLSTGDVAKEIGCTPSNVSMMMRRIGQKPYAKYIYQFLKEGL